MKRIPVKKVKIRTRIGGRYVTAELNRDHHRTALTLYRGDICLEAVVWKNEIGYPGKNGRKKLRISSENYGLGSDTGYYDKDIIRFASRGKTLVGLVRFDLADMINGDVPWHVVTGSGQDFLLREVKPLGVIGSLLDGDSLSDYPTDETEVVKEDEHAAAYSQADKVPQMGTGTSPSFSAAAEPVDVPEAFWPWENACDEIRAGYAEEELKEKQAAPVSKEDLAEEGFPVSEQMAMELPASENRKEKGTSAASTDLVFYTDGSALSNPGPCGGAYVMLYNGVLFGEKKIPIGNGTNNIAEITAVIEAMKDARTFAPSSIRIISDSQYVVKGANEWSPNWEKNGWITSSGKPVLNEDLWKELVRLKKELPVTFEWTRGHVGNDYNEKADSLAAEAARESMTKKR